MKGLHASIRHRTLIVGGVPPVAVLGPTGLGARVPGPQAPCETDWVQSAADAIKHLREAQKVGHPHSVLVLDLDAVGPEAAQQICGLQAAAEVVVHGRDAATLGGFERDEVLAIPGPLSPKELELVLALAARCSGRAREAEARAQDVEEEARRRTTELEQANSRLLEERREKDRIEVELRHASKLQAVGQLASGIAHEINTPIQYVGDSLTFVSSAFEDIQRLLSGLKALLTNAAGGDPTMLQALADVYEDCDWSYLEENVPKAIDRTFDGIERVATIVRAMKDFGHPDCAEMTPADINKALWTTMTVARNEYKYVADIAFEPGDIPSVTCLIGDLNQVFLNLLVNAAHAIADKTEGAAERGKISVRTYAESDSVIIEIEDSGVGIPDDVRERIFEPFFTTKEVGRGTGQGLSLARSIVVERHQGSLTFDSNPGVGTTFFVRLPVCSLGRNESTSVNASAQPRSAGT